MVHEERAPARGRTGQGLIEYAIIMSVMLGVGLGAVTALRTVMNSTVGALSSKIENLEFVQGDRAAKGPHRRHAPSGASRSAGGDARGALVIPSCKHPRVRDGECQVCHRLL